MGEQRTCTTEGSTPEDQQQLLQASPSASAANCQDKLDSHKAAAAATAQQPVAAAARWHKKALRGSVKHACSVIWSNGALCMAISSAVFSVSALFVKLTHDRIPTFQIVACRSSLSFLACAFGAHKAGIKPLFGKRQNWGFLLGRGICGAAGMTTYYLCIAVLPLADAVTLFFMNPAVTALAAWLLLKEPLGVMGGAGCLLSSVGLVLVAKPPFLFSAGSQDWDHQRLVGTGFGLLSALFAAGAFIFIRLVGKGEQALCMSVWFHTCAFTSSVLPLALGLPEWPVLPSLLDAALLIGIAATSFWGQILVGRGFQLLTAARGSAINFTQVVYSYIFGMAFLGESLSLLGMAGSLLIAAGIIMVNLRHQPKPAEPSSEPKVKAAAVQDIGQVEQGRGIELSDSAYGLSSPDSRAEKQPLLQGLSVMSHGDAEHNVGPISSAGVSVIQATDTMSNRALQAPNVQDDMRLGTVGTAAESTSSTDVGDKGMAVVTEAVQQPAGAEQPAVPQSLYSSNTGSTAHAASRLPFSPSPLLLNSSQLPPSPFSLQGPVNPQDQQQDLIALTSPDAASSSGWRRPLLAQVSGYSADLQDVQHMQESASEQQSSGVVSPEGLPTSWRALARLMGHLDSRIAVHAPDVGQVASSSSQQVAGTRDP